MTMIGLRSRALRILALLVLAGVLSTLGVAGAEEEGSQLIGKAADFQGKDLEGKTVTLKSLLGKGPIVVDFWATWCKPCIKELPHLQRMYEKYSPKGLSLLAISTDSPKTESQVKPFVLGKKYTFTVLLDPSQEIFRSLQGKGAMPYTVVIDAEGNIRYRHTGYRPGDENELERVVTELMGISAPEEKAAEPGTEESADPNTENSAG
jgi:peroxiredoxin